MSAQPKALTLFEIETELPQLLEWQQSVIEAPGPGAVGGFEDEERRLTLEACELQIREYLAAEIRKVDGTAYVLLELKAFAETARAEAKKINAKADRWEAKYERLEAMVMDVLRFTGKIKLESASHKLALHKTRASVDVTQPDRVPPEYQRVQVTLPLAIWQLTVECVQKHMPGLSIQLLDFAKESQPEPVRTWIADVLKCPECRGNGKDQGGKGKGECPHCKGSGESANCVPGCVLRTDKVHLKVE